MATSDDDALWTLLQTFNHRANLPAVALYAVLITSPVVLVGAILLVDVTLVLLTPTWVVMWAFVLLPFYPAESELVLQTDKQPAAVRDEFRTPTNPLLSFPFVMYRERQRNEAAKDDALDPPPDPEEAPSRWRSTPAPWPSTTGSWPRRPTTPGR
jgi:hypothetical protein